MTSLYELQNWRSQLYERALQGDENFTDTLESIECAIEEKAEGYVKVIRSLQAARDAAKAEKDFFKEKEERAKKAIERMEKALSDELTLSGKKEIKTGLFKINFRNNAPSVYVTDESLIPDVFFKHERTLKKSELAKTLKEMPVDGAVLRVNRSLQIK